MPYGFEDSEKPANNNEEFEFPSQPIGPFDKDSDQLHSIYFGIRENMGPDYLPDPE